MVESTAYDTQVNLAHVMYKALRSYARDLINALILRTDPPTRYYLVECNAI